MSPSPPHSETAAARAAAEAAHRGEHGRDVDSEHRRNAVRRACHELYARVTAGRRPLGVRANRQVHCTGLLCPTVRLSPA